MEYLARTKLRGPVRSSPDIVTVTASHATGDRLCSPVDRSFMLNVCPECRDTSVEKEVCPAAPAGYAVADRVAEGIRDCLRG